MRWLLLFFALLVAAPAAAQTGRGAILIYSGTTGFRHDSIPAGIQAMTSIARARGLTVVASEDPAVFSNGSLRRFRAIVLLSCTTDPKDPASEWLVGDRRTALQHFVRRGGGILAIHAAADSHYHWPWYGHLIGGHFARHPAGTLTGKVRTLATGAVRVTKIRSDLRDPPGLPGLPDLLARHRRLRGGHREHDAETEDDEHSDRQPAAADAREHAGLPQREDGADDQYEVANQVKVNEPHGVTVGTGGLGGTKYRGPEECGREPICSPLVPMSPSPLTITASGSRPAPRGD